MWLWSSGFYMSIFIGIIYVSYYPLSYFVVGFEDPLKDEMKVASVDNSGVLAYRNRIARE